MRAALLIAAVLIGGALAAFLYIQLAVEGQLGGAAILLAGTLAVAFLALIASFVLSGGPRRDLVGKIWLAVTVTALTFLVTDFAIARLLLRPLSPRLVPHEYRHHALVPDSYADFEHPEFSYVQRVNRHGLRGPEIELEKPAGTYRLVMLGDSFTMGKGVRDEETFATLLEQRLRAELAGCRAPVMEVMNAGVDSYAPVVQRIFLDRELLRFSPDLVIVNLDISDLSQERAYRAIAVGDAAGRIVAVPQQGPSRSAYERLHDWILRNLFFSRAVLFHASRSLGGAPQPSVRAVVEVANHEVVAHTLADDVDRTSQWDDLFESILGMRQSAVGAGAEFVLTTYPWAHQVSDSQWVPGRFSFMQPEERPSDLSQRTVAERSARAGIRLVDAFPAFREAAARRKLYFDRDMHWNAEGHRVMADVLAEALLPGFTGRWCTPG